MSMSTLYDGRTGLIIEDGPHRIQSTADAEITAPILRNSGGFGPAVKLLEVEPFRLAPWMTPEVAEQEIAMQGCIPFSGTKEQ